MVHPLYVTFTVKSWEDRIGLREVRRAFTKLRRLRWWKRRVRGGVAAFELSRLTEEERKAAGLKKVKGLGWHPHPHALIDCPWLSVVTPRPRIGCTKAQWDKAVRSACAEVAEQWSLCLGRPGSLHVRATFKTDNGDPTRGLKETIKYSVDMAALDGQDIAVTPVIRELQLTRNLVTWGSLYRHPSLKKQKRTATPCECGAVNEWLPEDLLVKNATGEDGLTDRQRKKGRRSS
jgi:hypothetical protein